MKEGCKQFKKLLIEGGLYLLAFLLALILFWVVKPYQTSWLPQLIMLLLIGVCVAFVAYMGRSKKLDLKKLTIILLVVGYILRVGYMLYTPAAVRQMDTYVKGANGHEAYAWTLLTTGKLPTHNGYQFYHPPLNAMLQAAFMRVMQPLSEGLFDLNSFAARFNAAKPQYIESDVRYYLYSSCQILCVLYSFITAVTLVKTVNLFGFSDRTKGFLFAFVVLYPRQIQFSGQLNNDGLSYTFGVLAMYFALRWQKGNKRLWQIIACAFAVGLGMMTKISSATVCLPIAGIFIYEFVQTLRKKEGSLRLLPMLGQYALFLAICAPIGLWFQVYVKARFNQEFGFVFSNLVKSLYVGDRSFFERFIFPFDWKEWFGSPYCRTHNGNYYLFHFALRSSIFAEFSYARGHFFAILSVIAAYASAILLTISILSSSVALVRSRGKEGSLYKRTNLRFPDLLFTLLLVQSQALSELYFYVKMPYSCTMDFRYVMPLILGMALLLGYTREIQRAEGSKFSLALNRATELSVLAFLGCSALFYCVCG